MTVNYGPSVGVAAVLSNSAYQDALQEPPIIGIAALRCPGGISKIVVLGGGYGRAGSPNCVMV